jgi:hypothetical protein
MKNKIMRNKRAFELLGETTLNLLIAVMCILVLIFLGVALYNLFLENKLNLEQAKSVAEEIDYKISLLETANENNMVIYNPKKWAVTFWTKFNALPPACEGKDCFCICDFSDWFNNPESEQLRDKAEYIKTCSKENSGICKPIKYALSKDNFFWLDEPVQLKFSLQNETLNVEKVV